MAERRDSSIAPTEIDAAASGDVEALAQIMAAHDGDMARICMVITGDPASARDAVQAAWLIAWRRLPTLRDAARLRPWLMSVAANEAKQLLRRERRRARHEARAADDRRSIDPAHRAEHVDLADALGRLSADERRLLALRYVGGLTSEEIGRELSASAAAIRGRIARVLARLRSELSDA